MHDKHAVNRKRQRLKSEPVLVVTMVMRAESRQQYLHGLNVKYMWCRPSWQVVTCWRHCSFDSSAKGIGLSPWFLDHKETRYTYDNTNYNYIHVAWSNYHNNRNLCNGVFLCVAGLAVQKKGAIKSRRFKLVWFSNNVSHCIFSALNTKKYIYLWIRIFWNTRLSVDLFHNLS